MPLQMLEEGYLQEHDFFFPSAPQRITSLPHLAVSLAWQGVEQVNLTYGLCRETAAVRPRRQSSDLVGRQCSTSLHSFLPSYFLTLLRCSPSLGEGDIDISFMAEHSPGLDSYRFDHVQVSALTTAYRKRMLLLPKLKTTLF